MGGDITIESAGVPGEGSKRSGCGRWWARRPPACPVPGAPDRPRGSPDPRRRRQRRRPPGRRRPPHRVGCRGGPGGEPDAGLAALASTPYALAVVDESLAGNNGLDLVQRMPVALGAGPGGATVRRRGRLRSPRDGAPRGLVARDRRRVRGHQAGQAVRARRRVSPRPSGSSRPRLGRVRRRPAIPAWPSAIRSGSCWPRTTPSTRCWLVACSASSATAWTSRPMARRRSRRSIVSRTILS